MKPILIGGTGRSGTTILKRILLQHPQLIGLPNELRILTDPGGIVDLLDALSSRWGPYYADTAIHRFVKLLQDAAVEPTWLRRQLDRFQLRVLTRLGIAPRRYIGAGLSYYPDKSYLFHQLQALLDDLSVFSTRGRWMGTAPFQHPMMMYETHPLSLADAAHFAAQFINKLYTHIATSSQTHWLDDTPTTILHAHRLVPLFPDMKLIHIVRDPRDVLASYVGFDWGGDDYVLSARRLAAYYTRWLDVRRQLPPASFVEIRLETLAATPERTLRDLCDSIHLPYTVSLQKISLDKTNTGRWRREVPPAVWQTCEPILHPFLAQFGYD